MLTSLASVLSAHAVLPEDTPYAGVCDHTFDAGDFFQVERIVLFAANFPVFARYEEELARLTAPLRADLALIEADIKRTKGDAWACRSDKDDMLRGLRVRKRAARGDLAAVGESFYAAKPEKYVVTYKNALLATTQEHITSLLPPLGDLTYGRFRQSPLFTRHLERLNAAALADVGIVGGPCLFTKNEMIAEVSLRTGTKLHFDLSTGENCEHSTPLDLAGYFARFPGQITGVAVDNRKDKLTLQDYESLAFPLEVAAILDAPFAFPIPDMSYIKWMSAITVGLSPGVRAALLAEFRHEAHRIADKHLDLFSELLKVYKPRRQLAIHDRDSTALRIFYDERAKYFRQFIRRPTWLTRKPEKAEAVHDYVSCLAAPHYFWNTKNVLQVDSIDETSSALKCSQAHAQALSLGSILFPEILSSNGVDTISNAPREHKIHV